MGIVAASADALWGRLILMENVIPHYTMLTILVFAIIYTAYFAVTYTIYRKNICMPKGIH